MATFGAYQASTEGALELIPHVDVEVDPHLTEEMIGGWLTSFSAHVGLTLGYISELTAPNLAMVTLAARRIVERYVAGDILDVVYQVDVGRTDTPPGQHFRDEALAELLQLQEVVALLLITTGAVVAGEVSVEWPLPRVTMGMRF